MSNVLFPTIPSPSIFAAGSQSTSQPAFKPDFDFDFNACDISIDGNGNIVLANGWQAWYEWCMLSVLTERYTCPLFDALYGVELDGLLGSGDRGQFITQFQATVTDALMVNPRTKSVGKFAFNFNGDAVNISFTVEPIVGLPANLSVVVQNG